MDIVLAIFMFLFGACVGSFLNVVVWRMPRGQSIVFPPSHCPSCGRAIKSYDNIPILSWFVLRGRCRFCQVRISARYVIVEAITSLLVGGLFLACYVFHLRSGMGDFMQTWPLYFSWVALICGLLACSLIDIETFHLPLEICWFITLVGIAASAFRPTPSLIPMISGTTEAVTVGAVLGLAVAMFLLKTGRILPSFLDADVPPVEPDGEEKVEGVAVTDAAGVNVRVEILREVLFLLPVIVGGVLGGVLYRYVPAVQSGWNWIFSLGHGAVGAHLHGLLAAVFGYFIGGACVWGVRIFGTLGFGKEAMGLGDVHLMAAAGAAAGWIVPTVAFFVAPFFGLGWALWLFLRKGQRELPYGPWLSLAVAVVLVFYDTFLAGFERYLQLVGVTGQGG